VNKLEYLFLKLILALIIFLRRRAKKDGHFSGYTFPSLEELAQIWILTFPPRKNSHKFRFSSSRRGRAHTNLDSPLPAVEEPTQIWILFFPPWKSPHNFRFSSSRCGRAHANLDSFLPAVEFE
jgi:hypothetical protein